MNSKITHINDASFRDTLGHFATGVTVVTATTETGYIGLTVNSFNSVSLEPPLILWSLSKTSSCINAFTTGTYFAIHIMASDQLELSRRFAQSGQDKFSQLDTITGVGGVPLIPGCSARLQCRTKYQYEGGDHIIFVGEVLEHDSSGRSPLLFHRGRFCSGEELRRFDTGTAVSVSDQLGFTEDFFPYLMARAHFQLNEPIKMQVERAGIDDDDCFVLLLLSIGEGRTIGNLAECLAHTSHRPTSEKIADMHERNLIVIKQCGDHDRIYLSEEGAELTHRLLAAAVDVEQNLRDHFGSQDTESLKTMLKKVIARTDPGVPDLWDAGT